MYPTRILHIPNYYPPHIGGIEDVCHSIVSSLPEYGHKVLCFHDRKQTLHDTYEGIEITRCGVWKKLFSQSISFTLYREMKKAIGEYNPDVVHFHMPNPLASAYIERLLPHRTELVVHWHSDIVAQSLLHLFYRPAEEWLLQRADRILVTSPDYGKASPVLAPWRNKLQVIPNTIHTGKLDKQPGDEEAILEIKKLYDNKKIIFAFGRHVPYKGFRYLVEALPFLGEDAVVVIAGQGPLTTKLKKMSGSKRLFFPGRLDGDTLRHYLYAANVFAFPSITRNEAFGIALAEAMYCGLPAVTFTIPGSGVNWVCPNGECGLETANSNPEDFADALNRILGDQELGQRLGRNARERVKTHFTMDAIKKDLERMYGYIDN